jgi:hypothetical protein
MNKRIQKLAKRAYEDVISDTPSFLVTKEMYEQKFAELIVRECLAICEELGADYDCHFAADKIAKRFLRS